MIVGAVPVVVILAFVSLWVVTPHSFEDLRALLQLLLAPVIGIVGAVTGFYFGSNASAGGGTSGPAAK